MNGIDAFLSALRDAKYRLHALMIWQNGRMLYESAAAPYLPDIPHRLFSAAKSILVLDTLRAIQGGRLHPDDLVTKYFTDMPHPLGYLDQLRIRDVLGMRTGQSNDPFPMILSDLNADLIRAFFETPAEEMPGMHFRYNNTVPHIVYALVERAYGVPFEKLHRRWFAEPMQAPLMAPTNSRGQYNPVVTTASARTLMKYARLFLQKGRWGNQTLVDPELIRMATSCDMPTGKEGNFAGYGWQIWGNAFGGYRMDGGWGQYAIVLPEIDTAVVMLSDMTDSSYALEAFESVLLPELPALTGHFPPLDPLIPAEIGYDGFSSLAGCWSAPGAEIRFSPEQGILRICIESRNEAKEFQIGLSGRFERNKGYSARPFSVDHSVYGQEPETVWLSGVWTAPNRFEIVGKCFAEMGETAIILTLMDEEMRIQYTPQSIHGIAAVQTEEMKEMTVWKRSGY